MSRPNNISSNLITPIVQSLTHRSRQASSRPAIDTILRSIVCAIVIFALALPANAKTQFENEFKKTLDELPVWIKAENYKGNVPVPGETVEISIADVDNISEKKADFTLTGTVTGSNKTDKKIDILLNNAQLNYKDDNGKSVKYTGDMALSLDYNKDTKQSVTDIILQDGILTVNEIEYLPINEKNVDDGDNIIRLDITYDAKVSSKHKKIGVSAPPFKSDFNDLYPSRLISVIDNTMNRDEEDDIYRKWKGERNPTDAEAPYYEFLRAASADGLNFKDFKNAKKKVIIKESPGNQFNASNISIFKDKAVSKPYWKYLSTEEILIPEVTTPKGYHIMLVGDTIIADNQEVTAKFLDGDIYSAEWPKLGASYASREIIRPDGSILSGIEGWSRSKSNGYLINKLTALALLNDVTKYDLREIPGNQLTASRYVSTNGLSEQLTDGGNIIQSLALPAIENLLIEHIPDYLSRCIGDDRTMMNINSLAKSVKVINGNNEQIYTFDEKGVFDGAFPYDQYKRIPDWSKFARPEGKQTVRFDKYKMDVSVTRNGDGLISTYVIDPINHPNKMKETFTFEYTNGKMTKCKYTVSMPGSPSMNTEIIYNYNNNGQVASELITESKDYDVLTKAEKTYSYNRIDEFGNWRERNVRHAVSFAGGERLNTSNTETYTETREIDYYNYDQKDIINRMIEDGYDKQFMKK